MNVKLFRRILSPKQIYSNKIARITLMQIGADREYIRSNKVNTALTP